MKPLSSVLRIIGTMASFPILRLQFYIFVIINLSENVLTKPGYNIDIRVNIGKNATNVKLQPESGTGIARNVEGN